MLTHQPHRCVLHVAALRDVEAMETLRRTVHVIAGEGVPQVLVALDDGCRRHAAWPADVPAEVSELRCAPLSLVGRVRALHLELTKLSCERPPYAVHLHGLSACLLGWQALKTSPLEGLVLCSPHWTPVRLPWANALLAPFLQAGRGSLRYAALAGFDAEAHELSRLLNRSVEVLPHVVSDLFFVCPRKPESRALIVADGCGAEAVAIVSRLCVLFNSREARVRFTWLGTADGESAAELRAANIELLDAADDVERAQVLSRASLFLYVSQREQAPHAVAQAMAAGLPCLVSDTLAHRAVVRHGETGYVCASERDFVEKLVVLLRDGAERRRLGEAARAEAERRFTVRHFQTAVLRAYGLARPTAPDASVIELTRSASAGRAPLQQVV